MRLSEVQHCRRCGLGETMDFRPTFGNIEGCDLPSLFSFLPGQEAAGAPSLDLVRKKGRLRGRLQATHPDDRKGVRSGGAGK